MTEPATDSEVERDAPVVRPNTPRSQLRAKRDQLRREREPLVLALPGYGDSLIAKYRPLAFGELKKIGQRVEKMRQAQDEEAELKGFCDALIAACVGLYARVEGKLTPLEESLGGEGPVRFGDRRLAADLGIPEENLKARHVLREVFGGRDDLITQHYLQVDAWQSAATTEDDEDF